MLPSLSTTNSITTDDRSSSWPSEVSCVESRSGSIGKVATPVYTDVAFIAAYWSVAEPLATVPSTSAIATRTFTSPLGSRSAISSWSRSFDESLSMDDQGSARRSTTFATTAVAGSLAFAASAATAAGTSGAKPFAIIARWAPARRSNEGGITRSNLAARAGQRFLGGLRQGQHGVGRRRVAHELSDVGRGVARFIQR